MAPRKRAKCRKTRADSNSGIDMKSIRRITRPTIATIARWLLPRLGKIIISLAALAFTCIWLQQRSLEDILSTRRSRLEARTADKCQIPKLTPGGKNNDNFGWNELNLPENIRPRCLDSRGPLFTIKFPENHLVFRDKRPGFWESSKCYYEEVNRLVDKPDFTYEKNPKRENITQKTTLLPVSTEHIFVGCKNKIGQLIYEDYLSTLPLKSNGEGSLPPHPSHYSVLILGIDSSSHMNFRRYFPRTHNYLLTRLEAVEFHGFQSHGPGTLWSLFPLLTNLNFPQYKNACWPQEDSPHDGCPFIWKDFAAKGYLTAYDEDLLEEGNFNGGGRIGFSRQPVHYDFRTVRSKQSGISLGHRQNGTVGLEPACYGSRLAFGVQLEDMVHLAQKLDGKPYFSLTWSGSLTHDHNFRSQFGDEVLLHALQNMHSGGHLARTILILLSDHGMRYREFREYTWEGMLEERLPLLYIVLPRRFKWEFPSAARNLQDNSRKLITTFDVHAMLQDVLHPGRMRDKIPRGNLEHQRAISLFLPVPETRTCQTVGVRPIYCACLNRKEMSGQSQSANYTAKFLVKFINNMTSGFPGLCESLKVKEIMNVKGYSVKLAANEEEEARRFGVSERPRNEGLDWTEEVLELQVRTEPGDAVFYGTVRNPGTSDRIVDDVNRISAYGLGADCMKDRSLKPFCVCKVKGPPKV